MSDRSYNLFYAQLEEECSGKYVQNEINKVLDEIKEEIRNTRDGRRMIRKMRVLEIIDKHKEGVRECEK